MGSYNAAVPCIVLMGNTRKLAQVSAEISEPKPSNPTEGVLHLNLEYSAVASPDAKSLSRTSDEVVEVSRLLERCIRDSKCVDLESLCIAAGSKVWTIRVDVHALNDDGNVIECSSIAAISALAHFRRPDVSVTGTEVMVHEDHEAVALIMHHMPISINLALFENGEHILIDPNDLEEKVADGCYVIGINAHQEICYVHRRGVLLLLVETIERCENAAVRRAQEVTQIIRKAINDDAYKRATNAAIGFENLIKEGTILGAKKLIPNIDLDSISRHEELVEPELITIQDAEPEAMVNDSLISNAVKPSYARKKAMRLLQEQEIAVFEGGRSRWGVEPEDEETSENSNDSSSDNEPLPVKAENNSESEEGPVYIGEYQVDVKPESRRCYSKDPFM